MPSVCVLVLGVPRSGTSCVAGCLHRIGCDMGAGQFQSKDWANPRGYYEDMRWRLTTQRITGKGYSLKAAGIERISKAQRNLYQTLAREYARKPLWGMKDPWLCFVAWFIWPILQEQGIETRMIVTERPREASIASVQRHLRKTYHGKGDAERIIDTWQAGLDRQLASWQGTTHVVDYERLVREPETVIREMAHFVFLDADVLPRNNEAATRWVSPELNHQGVK